MKVIVTLCFTFAFTRVVVSEVRYGQRIIRQSAENVDVGQLQQPPVAMQSSAISPDTVTLSSTNVAVSAQNLQPAQPISAPNTFENNQQPSQIPSNPMISTFSTPEFTSSSNIPAQVPPSNQSPPSATPSQIQSNFVIPPQDIQAGFPSQISSNSMVSTFSTPEFTSSSNIPAQIPPPNQSQPSATPSQIQSNSIIPPQNIAAGFPSQIPMVSSFSTPEFTSPSNIPGQSPPPSSTPSLTQSNPITPSQNIPTGITSSSNAPVQAPSQVYPYNPAMTFGRSAAAYPSPPYANPVPTANTQQYGYNPYYTQYPMAYTNPQMMYGMSPNAMYGYGMPPYPMQYMPPSIMNYGQTPYNNLTTPRNTSPYPYPPNYIPAPTATDESTAPTVFSSTGESGSDPNSLPPQVKEFMDMIPQILSMQESSPEQNTHNIKRPPLRKFPKMPPTSLLKKKQYYHSNYPSSQYSNYPQRYGYSYY